MARHRIHIYAGRRTYFTGTFVKYGSRPDSNVPTVLLVDIKDGYGELVGDHSWINQSADFISVGVQEGDIVGFNAYVREYSSGYMEHDRHLPIQKDWKLENPSNIRIVEHFGKE